jgi:hypothetical protein
MSNGNIKDLFFHPFDKNCAAYQFSRLSDLTKPDQSHIDIKRGPAMARRLSANLSQRVETTV